MHYSEEGIIRGRMICFLGRWGRVVESVWRRGQSWRRVNRVGGRVNCDGVENIMAQSSI